MLFCPVGTPFELLNQELDLPLVLSDTVGLSTSFAEDAVCRLGDCDFIKLEACGQELLGSPWLLILNLFVLVWRLIDPHRVTILNFAGLVLVVGGLLARYDTGVAALAVLGDCRDFVEACTA